MSNPDLYFRNELAEDLQLFDSYTSGDEQNYYGALTLLGTVKANGSAQVTALHAAVSVVIAFDTEGHPVGRYVALPGDDRFSITPQDLQAITDSSKFLDFLLAQPDDPLAQQFQGLLGALGNVAGVNDIDSFFSKTTGYADCTYATYMLALTDRAKHPSSPPEPDKSVYSLSLLCAHLGGTWPSGVPDIVVRQFQCVARNNTLFLGGVVTLQDIPFQNSAEGKNILSLFPVNEVDVEFSFSYQVGTNLFGTQIQFAWGDFQIPVGNGKAITIASPEITFDISPLFKFAVFQATATIPFNIFGKQFDAGITMTIDNVEAAISAQITGDSSSLPAPPPMKGVHFDQFGVEMGIIFEPPSYALGLQGKFHIGDGGQLVTLNDDNFALVCGLEGDVPNPLYISFYIASIDFATLVEVFTNARSPLDFSVTLQNLSFQWAENPMEPLVLPDGSLTQMAFGCSGFVELFGLEFYGSLHLSLQGVEGTLELSPIVAGNLLRITGNGKGISVKVDEQGNPLQNNIVPTTQAQQEAIAEAAEKLLIPPGGAELTISTSNSPYFSLSASVDLLGLTQDSIQATIDSSGVQFELDYGTILSGTVKCIVQGLQHFSGSFSYSLNTAIPLPSIGGVSLGSISLAAMCSVEITIDTSSSAIQLSIAGSFSFEDLQLSIGPFNADINIALMSQLLSAIEQYVVDHAGTIFAALLSDGASWTKLVKSQVINDVTNVAEVLKSAFGETADEAASIMNQAGYGINEAASAIGEAFGAGATALASALQVGYQATAGEAASILEQAGFTVTDISQALSGAFNQTPEMINNTLQSIGCGADAIKSAFEDLGGGFANFAQSTWNSIEQDLNPSNW